MDYKYIELMGMLFMSIMFVNGVWNFQNFIIKWIDKIHNFLKSYR